MINAGKYNKKISIYSVETVRDEAGFQKETKTVVCEPYANTRTTKGITLITNNSDFEEAHTNFTIRYQKKVVDAYENSNRDLLIDFAGKTYKVDYLNNIDEQNVEIELQAKVVRH